MKKILKNFLIFSSLFIFVFPVIASYPSSSTLNFNNYKTQFNYKVKSNDLITTQIFGLRYFQLEEYNNIETISPGEKIEIPVRGKSYRNEVLEKVEDKKINKLQSKREKVSRLRNIVSSIIKTKSKERMIDKLKTFEGQLEEIDSQIEEKIKNKDFVNLLELAETWEELSFLFLEKPTLKNLETFCKKAKEIKGPLTEKVEVLNEERTKLIEKEQKIKFIESFPECKKESDYNFVKSNKNQKVDLKDSDSDTERKLKIKYNEKIESIIQAHNLYGFDDTVLNEKTPNESFRAHCLQPRGYNCTKFLEDIIIPERRVVNIINRYFNKD